MTISNSYYLKFAKNIYSQCGEDGIIERLLKDLNIRSGGIVVEFGACDGVFLSNTVNLWKDGKFKSILIESDAEKCKDLFSNCGHLEYIECINKFVNPDSSHEDCLDNILQNSKFKVTSSNFAILSIDVDTCDYHIFESLVKFTPKIVVIETNTNFAPNEDHISNMGSSLKSITDLAEKKGYKLVCHTGNAFYVRNDLTDKLVDSDFSIENLSLGNDEVDILQQLGPEGKSLGYLYWASENYKKNVTETIRQLKCN